MTNRAMVLCDLQQYDEALLLCKEAEVIHDLVGNLLWAGVNQGAYGRVLSRMSQFDLAIQVLNKAKQMAIESNYLENQSTKITMYVDITKIYTQ